MNKKFFIEVYDPTLGQEVILDKSFEVEAPDVYLAHKKGLNNTKFPEDIFRIVDSSDNEVYHIKTGFSRQY